MKASNELDKHERENLGTLRQLPMKNKWRKLNEIKEEAKIKNMVYEIIDLFGVDRCMFASNYPVEMVQGISIETLYGKFLSWTGSMSETERSALFHDTATRVYKINGK